MTQQDLLNLFFQAYNDNDDNKVNLLLQAYPSECQDLLTAINRTNTIAEFKELFDYKDK